MIYKSGEYYDVKILILQLTPNLNEQFYFKNKYKATDNSFFSHLAVRIRYKYRRFPV